MANKAMLWSVFGVIAIVGNAVAFRYFYDLPIVSQQVFAVIFGTFGIVLGLFVLDVLRREGGWSAVRKALPNVPGACIIGGCIALSWAAEAFWLAASFVVAAFFGLVVGTYLWFTGRLDSQPRT